MWRLREGRLVGGVAAGIAAHLGLPVLAVRVGFTLLAAFGGFGIAAYALFWMFVPQHPGDAPPVSGRERRQGVGLILLAAGVVVGLAHLVSLPAWFSGPLLVALLGAVLVWREADDAQRRRWRQGARSGVAGALSGAGGRAATIRIGAGSLLVVAGLVMFLGASVPLADVRIVLLAVAAALIGAAVLTVPWWQRMVRDLHVERASRIRSQERAEIAAHLHDSVLQTLALIQKQADSSGREVRRLARSQERELRTWLYGPGGYGGSAGAGERSSLSTELARVCGEVEDDFAIGVGQVVVGDCAMGDPLAAQLAATREAVVNAAKHAGVAEVSVYAEVEPERVSIYVRDRGTGFDPDQVPADRHGLADSIRGRVERHGGTVRVRTAPGEGTEVQMQVPRTAPSGGTGG
ncbi:PspC domain-containing protein [Saccharopolyspora sp. HNM0983]|uniref:PspC domain-containing protein n=1 Tax=Saccharopolyspora montiporae TaxID=2781240 RepID=A0A929G080_9PSEU|nr:ATP-binding protein [Saccharopolyspora sp. HNM0983]MBE9375069.1 PspC domain-containing protein [Saccharopolyspora sp. HNM0983]